MNLKKIAAPLPRMVGRILKFIDPKLYVSVRWNLRRIMGQPMGQLFLLPYFVRKNDTVVDIGANIGEISILLGNAVGENGKVLSFEPIKKNYDECLKNVSAAGLNSRVMVNKLGLSEKSNKAVFTVPKDRMTEATLKPHSDEDWKDYFKGKENYYTEECEITTLDEFTTSNNINDIKFIKCDVEGGELPVLKGAEKLLKSDSPPILLLEQYEKWTKDFGYQPSYLFDYLHEIAGYECYWISPDGLQYIPPMTKDVPGIFYQWIDFVFIVPRVHNSRIDIKKYISNS